MRKLLELLLKDEASGGNSADAMQRWIVARGTIRPDLVLSDYNLPMAYGGHSPNKAAKKVIIRPGII